MLQKNIPSFTSFFIKNERDFLYNLSPELFKHEDFCLYIDWYIGAIQSYILLKYVFKDEKANNWNLIGNFLEDNDEDSFFDRRFLVYFVNKEFRGKVLFNILKYQIVYRKTLPFD